MIHHGILSSRNTCTNLIRWQQRNPTDVILLKPPYCASTLATQTRTATAGVIAQFVIQPAYIERFGAFCIEWRSNQHTSKSKLNSFFVSSKQNIWFGLASVMNFHQFIFSRKSDSRIANVGQLVSQLVCLTSKPLSLSESLLLTIEPTDH